MKKILFGAAALAMLATVSCKKSDDGGSSNTFTIGGTTYTSAAVTSAAIGQFLISASDGSATAPHSIGFQFNGASTPTAGTYKVVSSATASGQVSVSVNNGSTGASNFYQSTGNDNVSATVTVNGGKVTVTLPNTWVKHFGGTTNDSLQVSTSGITQP